MDNPLKIGIVGLDTSHCPAFTGLLNDETNAYHVPGGRVIGAFPGGSGLFSLSRNRVAGSDQEESRQYSGPGPRAGRKAGSGTGGGAHPERGGDDGPGHLRGRRSLEGPR